jgi:endonuclease YncB( thermonuclease family)
LRERVVGRKCEFHIEYNINNKDYGTLIVDGENINLALVKSGLVKVIEKKGNMQAASNYE